MDAPRLSFIVALRDCLPLTQTMLRTLEAHTDLDRAEVVLIDDGSTDGTPEFLKSLPLGRYRSIRNQASQGYAAANNRAAAAARGEILVLLNNDLELSPGWLPPMLELLESQPQAGVVGNIQRNWRTGLVDHAGIFFDLEGMPTHAWKTRKRLPKGPWRERNAVSAACLAIRRSLFERANGFDTGYRNGMEDVDLCIRLKQMGYRHFVSHRSVVRHHVSQSPGRHRCNDRNSARFAARWNAVTRTYGKLEWPREYLSRYARYWWRMKPGKTARALLMLLEGSKKNGKYSG